MGCYFFLFWLLWARLPFQDPYIYIYWASDLLFLPLGPNRLFCYLFCQFFVVLIIGLFWLLGFHKWPSTFSPLNIWNVSAIHMWMKRRFCPSLIFFFLLLFRGSFFLKAVDPFLFIHISSFLLRTGLSLRIFQFGSYFQNRAAASLTPFIFWWLTLHLFSCWH